MYTEIPPVRADFYAAEIVYYPGKPTISGENYILIKSPDNIEYIINDFKTSKLYEVIRGKLPKNLCKELLLSLHYFPRKYLFVSDDDGNKPFDRKTFSAWSTKVLSGALGKHLTLTMLRHLYISEKVDFNKSIKTLNKVSRAMGHSIGMQKQYHWIDE
jgi:integrase